MTLDRYLAELCFAAYQGQYAITNNCGLEYVYELCDKKTDTQCYVALDPDDNVFIIFRGSDSVRDWVSNFQFQPVEWMGYETHKGFVRSINSVLQQIHDLVAPHAHNQIYVTGHSMGGALALLTALGLPYPVNRVVTFGQPKTVDSAAHSQLRGAEYVRYVNHGDGVPKLPFKWLAPYRHFGTLQYIDSQGGIVTDPHHLRRFWDGLGAGVERLTDHMMGAYLTHLR